MPDPMCTARRHGTTRHAYKRNGCRCPAAVAAARRQSRRDLRSRRERRPLATGWSQPRHRDVDEVAVDLVLTGRLGVTERALVIDRLTDAGQSARQIAQALQIAERTVTRRRAARRAALNGASQ